MKRLVEARRHLRDWGIPDLPPLASGRRAGRRRAVTDATAQRIADMRARLASITQRRHPAPRPAART